MIEKFSQLEVGHRRVAGRTGGSDRDCGTEQLFYEDLKVGVKLP